MDLGIKHHTCCWLKWSAYCTMAAHVLSYDNSSALKSLMYICISMCMSLYKHTVFISMFVVVFIFQYPLLLGFPFNVWHCGLCRWQLSAAYKFGCPFTDPLLIPYIRTDSDSPIIWFHTSSHIYSQQVCS